MGAEMYLSRINIKNFRNFSALDVRLSGSSVVIGENRVGKSNLIYGLRLLLDPSLPDTGRQLVFADFWDGLKKPKKTDFISISVEIKDFEKDMDVLAVLTDFRLKADATTARLTYEFRPKPDLGGEPTSEDDYEFICYGGEDEAKEFGHGLRRRLTLEILPALRDAEGDLGSWRYSPLRPLIDAAMSSVDSKELEKIAAAVEDVTAKITQFKEVKSLQADIAKLFGEISGPRHDIKPRLGLSPTDSTRLHRSIRLLIDEGRRGIADASLGSANLVFLTLKALEIRRQLGLNQRDHTVIAIEEPEAHLHPHLQRLVYRHFFGMVQQGDGKDVPISALLTTHSPQIASVAPLKSLLLLKGTKDGTIGTSTASLSLSPEETDDLARYLDVTRAEMLFARGVVLVEGDAEKYLVPLFSSTLEMPLDQVGVTVCSVAGTNFRPYAALLTHLGIPFSIITDWDPRGEKRPLGANRLGSLIREIVSIGSGKPVAGAVDAILKGSDYAKIVALAEEHGIFTNKHTLEVDLYHAGFGGPIIDALRTEQFGEERSEWIESWVKDPKTFDPDKYLSLIDAVGKGRFAQRIAFRMGSIKPPEYIGRAVKWVYSRV
jgi:putative ATP-dependent endonuclease of the OLD family